MQKLKRCARLSLAGPFWFVFKILFFVNKDA